MDTGKTGKLRASFGGEAVEPGDAGYDVHRRVWNGSIDRHPLVILRCRNAADIVEAVRFARDRGLLIAVRGGGHSFPGLSTCDGGVVVDLSPMKGIEVDPAARIARVEAGVLLGELDRATQPFGLAVPAGIVTHTGVAGLTLGGGIGWLHRKFGLTIDNLRSVELVTAAGDIVKASDTENADLFWGVRGGSGNFGIVTQFEFALRPVGPEVMAGPVFWPVEATSEVLRFYRDWIAGCPDELMTIVVQRKLLPVPSVPVELVGRQVIGITACYSGPVQQGQEALRALKSFGSPLLDLCRPKLFLDHQAMFDPAFQPGRWYYVRSCDVAHLNDEIIQIVSEHGRRIVSPITSIALWQMGGAVARVGEHDTAFHGRQAGHTFNINGNALSADGFEAERRWARDYWDALAPYHTSVYVNFLMEEGEDRVRQAYGPAKYQRLKELKQKYDPANLFRLNQNIRP